MGWQTIDTAPRDGTKVLLVIEDSCVIGFWNGRSWDDGDFYDHLGEPRHWMPIPALPLPTDGASVDPAKVRHK